MGSLTRESIVDNITLYWLTGHRQRRPPGRTGRTDERWPQRVRAGQAPPAVSVPVGFTTFPGEIWAAPRSWVEQSYPGLAYFNEVDRGGHFAAWEEPELFSDEVRAAFSRCERTEAPHEQPGRCGGSALDGRFARLRMPSLGGATEWLNSEPLGPAELRGHVVLVNFWTLTCINWLRQEPYVRAWSQAYRDDGLVVIGVHTPEFSFEHEIDRVRQATKERAIDYPVALDNDYEVWSAFDNHYWPALYFVDREGVIRDQHFGEGRYEESERVIQRLLGVERELVSVEGLGVEAEADWDNLRTPETYLGYARSEHFASPDGAAFDERRATCFPTACVSTSGPSPASGRSGARTSCSTRPAGASPTASTRATRISCSLPERESRFPSACSSTARLRARHTASTSTRTGTACSREGRLYQLVRQHDAVRERTLEITFLEPGAEAYVFTFG